MLKNEFEGYELRHCDPGFHLQRVNNKVLKICQYSLLTELVYGAHLMFEDSGKAGKPAQLARLEKQISILRTDPPVEYGSMHRGLVVFDTPNDIALHNIRSNYSAVLL